MRGANFWGDIVITLRGEQGISQRQLATGAKVNRSTLRKIEDGSSVADVGTIERILDYMGYELEVVTYASQEEVYRRRVVEAQDPNARSRLAVRSVLSRTRL